MPAQTPATSRPDVVIVLVDDMGYSDIGCYGGEVRTPNLDRMSANGIRLSQFYNTARCSPSRASLMTGLHPHQTGIGILTFDDSPDGYPGTLNNRCVTIAQLLGRAGYATYLSGKWHMANDFETPNDAWPTRRGFQRFFGTLAGGGSFYDPSTLMCGEEAVEARDLDPEFYYTDAISDRAAEFVAEHQRDSPDQPLFLYVAYTAPHWPLHAPEEDVVRYEGIFDDGWDALRERRMQRLIEAGLIDASWALSERDPDVPAWNGTSDQAWQARRMSVYAAQIDRVDQGVGRLIAELERADRLDNTLFLFMSDNGACAEAVEDWVPGIQPVREKTKHGRPVEVGNTPDIVPGPETTYASYGRSWANLSDTPFREYKHWVHEGGIATPLIAHWPSGFGTPGSIQHQAHQLPDIMATVLDATGVEYPDTFEGQSILSAEGHSMLATFRGQHDGSDDRLLFWEHEGNAAVRRGPWKLVCKYPGPWELYNLDSDRTELHDRANEHPEIRRELAVAYQEWADRCGVLPREQVLELYRHRGWGLPGYHSSGVRTS